MTQDQRFALIAAWQNAKTALNAAKDAEAAARHAMYAACFPEQLQCPVDGTHYAPLHNGWRLQAIFGTTYKLDADKMPNVLLHLAASGEAGNHAADTCFKYEPKLVMPAYKNLMPSMQAIINTAVTTAPTSPQFKLVEPKAGKAAA